MPRNDRHPSRVTVGLRLVYKKGDVRARVVVTGMKRPGKYLVVVESVIHNIPTRLLEPGDLLHASFSELFI